MREMAPNLLLFAGSLPSALAHGSLWGGAQSSSAPQKVPCQEPYCSKSSASGLWPLLSFQIIEGVVRVCNDPRWGGCHWEPAPLLLGRVVVQRANRWESWVAGRLVASAPACVCACGALFVWIDPDSILVPSSCLVPRVTALVLPTGTDYRCLAGRSSHTSCPGEEEKGAEKQFLKQLAPWSV